MAVPTPFSVPINPASIPPWALTVRSVIDAALVDPAWNAGEVSRTVTIPASRFSRADIPDSIMPMVQILLNEYRAVGWITDVDETTSSGGAVRSYKIRFSRWAA